MGGVDVRTVVEGESHVTGRGTVVNTVAAIENGSYGWAGNGRGVCAGRDGVGVAGGSVVELAVGCATVFWGWLGDVCGYGVGEG